MSAILPEAVQNAVNARCRDCRAHHSGRNGHPDQCGLAIEPERTERSFGETYYHAVCNLEWTNKYKEEADFIEVNEMCWEHLVYNDEGQLVFQG